MSADLNIHEYHMSVYPRKPLAIISAEIFPINKYLLLQMFKQMLNKILFCCTV